jgi:hypothetical protein
MLLFKYRNLYKKIIRRIKKKIMNNNIIYYYKLLNTIK